MPSPLSRLALLLAALAGSNFASPASGELPRALWEARVVNAPAVAPVLSGDTLWVVGTRSEEHHV